MWKNLAIIIIIIGILIFYQICFKFSSQIYLKTSYKTWNTFVNKLAREKDRDTNRHSPPFSLSFSFLLALLSRTYLLRVFFSTMPIGKSGQKGIYHLSLRLFTLNLQTLLNFIGSPVRYSRGVTALANISRRKAPLHGAWTRNDTMFPTTDCNTYLKYKNRPSACRTIESRVTIFNIVLMSVPVVIFIESISRFLMIPHWRGLSQTFFYVYFT